MLEAGPDSNVISSVIEKALQQDLARCRFASDARQSRNYASSQAR